MKKFAVYILTVVLTAISTVFAFNVMDAKAEEASLTITVGTMADTVRELKLAQYGCNGTAVIYEDAEVSIRFLFEKVTEQEWEEAWEGFTQEELELARQELIVAYGVSMDEFHDIVTEGWFTTSASYRPYYTLVMV